MVKKIVLVQQIKCPFFGPSCNNYDGRGPSLRPHQWTLAIYFLPFRASGSNSPGPFVMIMMGEAVQEEGFALSNGHQAEVQPFVLHPRIPRVD